MENQEPNNQPQEQNQQEQGAAPASTEGSQDLLGIKNEISALKNNHNQFVDVVNDIFSASQSQQAPAPKEDPAVNEQELEDLGFDNKQVNYINKLAQSVAEKTAKNVYQAQTQQVTLKGAAQKYDEQAMEMYPDLNNKQSRFYQVTQEIVNRHKSIDPNAASRPDLVYSAALEAEKRIAAAGNPSFSSSEQVRRGVVERGASFGSGNTGRVNQNSDDGKVTERRQWVKDRLGTLK